jgi:hypothetical protein
VAPRAAQKPAVDGAQGPTLGPQSHIEPIPQQSNPDSGIKANPTSTPQVVDPQERTAAKPIRQVVHVELVGLNSTQAKSANQQAGWTAK